MDRKIVRVFENMPALLEYRGIVKTSPEHTSREFISLTQSKGYYLIRGTKEPKGILADIYKSPIECVFIIISHDSKANSATQDFLNLIANTGVLNATTFTEITVITAERLSKKILTKMQAFEEPIIYVENHIFDRFTINLPLHQAIPVHKIMERSELAKLEGFICASSSGYQRILSSDPMSIWSGAKPGDVLKISRISDISGLAEGYRTVSAEAIMDIPNGEEAED
jgi:DNA-directed RNA polymerase subunit H (RpoH/RPB5)